MPRAGELVLRARDALTGVAAWLFLSLLLPMPGLATDSVPAVEVRDVDCVILLHGLARSARSMSALQKALTDDGYQVANIGYPSRSASVEELAIPAINSGIERCDKSAPGQIHFVTHSMGGILLRWYLEQHSISRLGNTVMLAPPNNGSEVVDAMADWPGYKWLNGPAGKQLGTDLESLPQSLGPANFELGIIAGNKTINPILSQFLPNPDDGKVSVASAKLEGMRDFLVVDRSHPMILGAEEVIMQTAFFLKHKHFCRITVVGAMAQNNTESIPCSVPVKN